MDDKQDITMEESFTKKVDLKYHTDEEKEHLDELEHERHLKEKELINEEVEFLEEQQDETLWDLVVIYFGLGILAMGVLLYFVANFSMNQNVIKVWSLGGIITLVGIAWKFIIKRHLQKEKKKLDKEEEEIREWDQV